MPGDPTFGARMAAQRKATGIRVGGRRRIADKHGRIIDTVERILADALPDETRRYLDELQPKEPERCEFHGQILQCPVEECSTVSQRVPYDHKAAQYVFDRIMGKPTTRTETAVTVRFVEHILEAVFVAFGEANVIPDPTGRAAAFAAACQELAALAAGAQG